MEDFKELKPIGWVIEFKGDKTIILDEGLADLMAADKRRVVYPIYAEQEKDTLISELMTSIKALRQDNEKVKAQLQDMVEKAATKRLPAYREMVEKLFKLEEANREMVALFTEGFFSGKDHDRDEWVVRAKEYVSSFLKGFEGFPVYLRWQSVELFQMEPNVGYCWIVHKGKVIPAYHDEREMFRCNKTSRECYMTECISKVMPWPKPDAPTDKPPEEYHEGEVCHMAECLGILEYPPIENCSCHIHPPCSKCVDNKLVCTECGWADDE